MATTTTTNNPVNGFWDGVFDFGRDALGTWWQYDIQKQELGLANAYAQAEQQRAMGEIIAREKGAGLAGVHPAVWIALAVAGVGIVLVAAR